MTTSKVDAQKIIDWLNKHWQGNHICPICMNTSWAATDDLFELRTYFGGSLKVGGIAIFPLVAVTCDTCGHTLLFNAVIAGLVKGQE